MAFLNSVKTECERRNRKNRNVLEHRFTSFNIDSYWSIAANNNFLITGGDEALRTEILASALKTLRMRFNCPVIILNGSRNFESRVVAMATSGQIGKLTVSSPSYKNYDALYKTDPILIRDLIQKIGLSKGIYDIGALGDYTDSFLKILTTKYVPNLHSMKALAERSDEAVANFGRAQNVDKRHLDVILNGIDAGRYFRQILNDLCSAFEEINGAKATGFNLSGIKNYNNIFMVWTRSRFQNIFNMELAAELNSLITSGASFFLIINDSALTKDDGLCEVIKRAKDLSSSRVGICSQNVISWSKQDSSHESLLGNFPSMLVLSSGFEDVSDQKVILERFGSYMHYESDYGVGMTPGLFKLPGTGAAKVGMTHYEKLRISVEDMREFSIAAGGHRGSTVELFNNINIT